MDELWTEFLIALVSALQCWKEGAEQEKEQAHVDRGGSDLLDELRPRHTIKSSPHQSRHREDQGTFENYDQTAKEVT